MIARLENMIKPSKILILTASIFIPLFMVVAQFFQKESRQVESVVVVDSSGDTLQLTSGEYIGLLGVETPRQGEANYRDYIERYLRERVLKKNVSIRRVLKAKKGDSWWYPQIDLVDLYLLEDHSLINLNKELLRKGMAFYSWEFFGGSKEYKALEEQAKVDKVGIWQSGEKLELLYVTKDSWKELHFPECFQVKNLKDEERNEYFVEYPAQKGGRGLGYRCSYCGRVDIKKREKVYKVWTSP